MRCLPMINKHKKFLTAAVFCAIASTGFVLTASAEETMTHDLDEVVVEADKDALPGGYVKTKGSIGILGEKSVLDVPFSNMNITQKTIETFGGPNQPLQSILANNPAVRIQGTTLHNDFSIRGIKGNGTSSYLNGIPGLMTQFAAPTFMIGDIQFISGPNSGITGIPSTYETTAAGGIVNFVSKKATEAPLTRYRQTFSGKGSFGEYLDVSRRFGKDKESKKYGFDGLAKESEGYIIALNHEQKMNADWKWFLNAGMNSNKLQRNIIGASSNFVIINDKGDVSNNLMSTQTVTKNYYAQLGINGNIKTGAVNHDVTLALDKAWHSIEGAKNMSMGSVSGNIYSGLQGNNVWYPSIETGLSSKDQYWGISLADTVKYKKAQLLLGVHKHNASVDSYNKITGRVTQTVGSDALCPTYGFVYQPDEHTSLYASHSENFDKGTIVASKYANAGEVLNPAKTKQNEIGFKYANAGFLTSLGIFNIKQANNIDVYKGSDMYLQQDGEQEYQGIELSVNGKLADKWNFMGGLMYLDATQNKTQNGTNDGKTVNGAAKWNAVAVLEYNPDEKFSIVGRAMYTGKADIYNEQLQTPSYMTYDLGVNYKTAFNKTPVTLTAMCYNLTDKNYWTAYGNNLILSSPRTLMLSATFDI